MRRLVLAFRVFFLTLFRAAVAQDVERLLAEKPAPQPAAVEPPKPRPAPKAEPQRSEALNLLAALQREARFVDFIQESIDGYTDAQIGAASRQVHDDCRKVLERLFALHGVVAQAEGDPVDVPAGFDAGRFRLTGNVAGAPPYRGRLVHHGWEAAQCQLPAWSGSATSARVVAPAEVELS
jgi:hypothetical protein